MEEKDIKTINREDSDKLSEEDLSKIAGGWINSPFDEANWLGFTEGTWAVGHYLTPSGEWASWPGTVVGMQCDMNLMAGIIGPYKVTIERVFPTSEHITKTFDVNDCTKE